MIRPCFVAARNAQNNALSFRKSLACNTCDSRDTLALRALSPYHRQRIDTIRSSFRGGRSYGDVLGASQYLSHRMTSGLNSNRSNSRDTDWTVPVSDLIYGKLLSRRLFSAHSVRDDKRDYSGHLGVISEAFTSRGSLSIIIDAIYDDGTKIILRYNFIASCFHENIEMWRL